MSSVFRGRGFIIVLAVFILTLGIAFFFHPAIAIYNQNKAGGILAQMMQSNSGMLACEMPPLSDNSDRAQVQAAVALLDQAIQYEPGYSQSYLFLGQALCLAGEYPEATSALGKASQLRPKNHLAGVERGFALEKACPPKGECANGDRSASVWKTAGVTAAQFITNGENARKLEEFEQAVSWYQRAQQMGADLRSTIAYINYQLCGITDTNCATLALSDAIEINAGWTDQGIRFLAWYYYGRLMFNDHDWNHAEQILQQAVIIYPGGTSLDWALSDTHRLLGLLLANQEKYKEALFHLQEAVDLNPNSYWAHIHLGIILYKSDINNLFSALKEFDVGLDLAGLNGVVWDDVVRNWILFNQPEIAKHYCDKAKQKGVNMTEMKHCLEK